MNIAIYNDRIYNSWIKIFGIKKDEAPKFNHLFFHSFFLWWFISFYFVAANGVFITYFSSEYLPLAYVGAGIMGYLVSLLYSFAQKFIKPKYLFFSALGIMIVLSLLSRASMPFLTEAHHKWLAFFVFIWAWPFISLVNIESGGLALQFLNLRQVKQQFGMINIGGIISSILSYFIIPFIMPFLSHPFDLLYIGIIGLVIGLFIVSKIYKNFSVESTGTKKTGIKEKPTGSIFQLIKQRYFLFIFVSAIFSMLAIYFTDFGYLSSIKIQSKLITTAADAANFISLMAGIVKTGEFLLSYFSNRLLGRYGMKLGLNAMPIGMFSLVTLSAIAALTFGPTSITFFIIIVITKAAERILRRGLDDPSFNILYQPLQGKQKLEIQTKVGVVMQLAIGIAGILLYAISKLLTTKDGFQLQYYPLFYLPVLALWVLIARNLYKSYKAKLRQILADISKKFRRDPDQHKYGEELLIRKFKNENMKVIRFSVNILAETNPSAMDRFASTLLELNDKDISRTILKSVDTLTPRRVVKTLNKEIKSNKIDESLMPFATQALDILQLEATQADIQKGVEELCNSEQEMEQLRAIKFIATERPANSEKLIETLLKSRNRRIVNAALKLAGKLNSASLNKRIVSFIEHPEHSHTVVSVLTEANKNVFSTMEKYFEKEDVNFRILLRLVEIYAKVGTTKAKRILIKHLSYPNKEIQEAVIKALYFCRYQATEETRSVIVEKIKEFISKILYLKVILEQSEDQKYTFKLIQSLELERDYDYELLFNLLSFIYKPSTISLIRKNILGANTIFALELIDNFLDQDIKLLIVPLFDNFSLSQKLRKYKSFVTISKINFNQRLREIIKVDYSQVNTWTRTKAIELIGRMHRKRKSQKQIIAKTNTFKDIKLWESIEVEKLLEQIRKSEMPDEIFVALHHRHELIYTTAVQIVYEENPARCYDYLQRFSHYKRNLFNVLEGGSDSGRVLITERVKYLRRNPLFFTIPEHSLVKLAEIFNLKTLKKDEHFLLESPDLTEFIIIVLKGKLTDVSENITFEKEDFIAKGLSIAKDANEIKAFKTTTILFANRFEYFNLLLDEVEILNQMFDMLETQEGYKH